MNEMGMNPEVLALTEELDRLRSHLVDVIEERDDLIFHQAPSLKTDFILKVGAMEFEMFELECGIARMKRKIDMVQACINLDEPVDLELIEQKLELEYAEFIEKLTRMAEELDLAKKISKLTILTAEETAELKRLYRSIAKLVHPDVNGNIDLILKHLWNRSAEAYEACDVEELGLLYEAILSKMKTDREESGGSKEAEQKPSGDPISELKERIEKAKKGVVKILLEIDKIRQTFPFTEADFLADPEKVSARQAELTGNIEDARILLKDLSDKYLMVLPASVEHLS